MAAKAVVWVALLCLSPSVARPQPAEVEASLRVRQVSGQTTFVLGELIRMELEFQGRAGSEYAFLGTGDGGFETYSVTPAEDVDDPRAELQASGMGIAGSFVSSPHPLDGTPMLQRVLLNDWVRFRRPGEYRLVVTSRRLERNRSPAMPLTSNALAFRIVAPPANWLETEVLRATALVDAGTPEGIREGLAVLRHLGTPKAGLALVARHGVGGESRSYEVLTGLIASPGREEIVKAMEARLDSGSPLSPGFIPDISLLRSLVDHPVGTFEPQPRFENIQALQAEYTKRWGRGIERAGASQAAFASVLAGMLGGPGSEAAAELLASRPDLARAAFLSLPSERQAALLQYQWDSISGWIGPSLETIYARWHGDGRQSGAGDLALKRIFETDRERGEALIAAEVKTGAHRITTETLLTFPDDAVKGIDDDTLMQRLVAQHAEPWGVTALWLIARYGSPELVPVVRQMLRCGPPCEIEAAALAYQLKHDAETGVARLQPGFDRSCAACPTPPWMALGPRLWDDRVEAAAIANLGAPGFSGAQAAAQALQFYGSAKCKGPLLARLVRLKAESPRSEESSAPTMFEGAMVSALFGNDRLELTDDDIARIRAACVSRGCRDYVEGLVRARAARRSQ